MLRRHSWHQPPLGAELGGFKMATVYTPFSGWGFWPLSSGHTATARTLPPAPNGMGPDLLIGGEADLLREPHSANLLLLALLYIANAYRWLWTPLERARVELKTDELGQSSNSRYVATIGLVVTQHTSSFCIVEVLTAMKIDPLVSEVSLSSRQAAWD